MSVNSLYSTFVYFNAACHDNTVADNKWAGSRWYIPMHLLRKLSNVSANTNVSNSFQVFFVCLQSLRVISSMFKLTSKWIYCFQNYKIVTKYPFLLHFKQLNGNILSLISTYSR